MLKYYWWCVSSWSCPDKIYRYSLRYIKIWKCSRIVLIIWSKWFIDFAYVFFTPLLSVSCGWMREGSFSIILWLCRREEYWLVSTQSQHYHWFSETGKFNSKWKWTWTCKVRHLSFQWNCNKKCLPFIHQISSTLPEKSYTFKYFQVSSTLLTLWEGNPS